MIASETSLSIVKSSYFQSMAQKICEQANVTTAIISEFASFSSTKVHTLAIHHNNKSLKNIQYDLDNTPCAEVINGSACFYPSDIQKLYPKDEELVNLNAESYCGLPLVNDSKEVIGHICIIHDKPLEQKGKYLPLLESFSIPALIELERRFHASVLNNLVSAFNIRQGKYFFINLAEAIQGILKADYVFISQLSDVGKKKASSLASMHQGKAIDKIEYYLSGTPCESVLNKEVSSFSSNVQNEFPNFQLLKEVNAESYVGSLLLNRKGKAIGIISVLNTTKINNLKTYESLINIFAVRAADELNRRKIEQELEKSKDEFRALYDDTPAMFFNTDTSGTILMINEYGARLLGYQVDELIGKNINTTIHSSDIETRQEKLNQCINVPGSVSNWNLRKLHKNGSSIMVRETVRAITNSQNSPAFFIVCEDISEAFQLSEQLSYQATHDPLTGLINRSEFERRLKNTIEKNQKNPEEHALCYLDLDQFKVINDTCGHLAGDALLRELSELLLSGVRKSDTLARLGGDEFGILMEHCGITQAQKVTESLRKAVEGFRFAWKDKHFSVGVSIGLVPISIEIGNVNEVLSIADAACYTAKDTGRNRVHLFSIDDIEVSQRRGEMQWVSRINQALEQDLFLLYHQKIMPVHDEKGSGAHCELLIRMKTKSGEIISPGAFLPAAERYGLSTKIDRWVIDSAFSWLSTNPEILNSLNLFNINLSGQSLSHKEFMNYLNNKLDKNQIIASKICFEITETAAVANLSTARNFINKMKRKGCSFALDDFGSGVSSFRYLRDLPVDYLKIDGSFVRGVATDRIDRAMVKSINEVAEVMGKKTIAEFVENSEIFDVLKKLKVDYAQGYFIGKPEKLI